MTCKDCIHSGLCYKENDYDNFPDRCGDFISDKVLEERPQGDLISREVLKANCISCFSEWCSKESRHCDTCSSAIVTREMIDNAPTVEEKSYAMGYQDGAEDGLRGIRPHGKWNHIQSGMRVCPFCGAMPHKLYKNFCAKCGADMRG